MGELKGTEGRIQLMGGQSSSCVFIFYGTLKIVSQIIIDTPPAFMYSFQSILGNQYSINIISNTLLLNFKACKVNPRNITNIKIKHLKKMGV